MLRHVFSRTNKAGSSSEIVKETLSFYDRTGNCHIFTRRFADILNRLPSRHRTGIIRVKNYGKQKVWSIRE